MPSQFQPYYPRPLQPAVAAAPAAGKASNSKGDSPLDQLVKAIQKQRAAQQVLNQPPDALGNLGDEAFINQSLAQTPDQVPAVQPAIDNLGVLNDESLIGSYY
jgi:hypothetical protein